MQPLFLKKKTVTTFLFAGFLICLRFWAWKISQGEPPNTCKSKQTKIVQQIKFNCGAKHILQICSLFKNIKQQNSPHIACSQVDRVYVSGARKI